MECEWSGVECSGWCFVVVIVGIGGTLVDRFLDFERGLI